MSSDGAVQVALVEPAVLPVLGEIPKLALSVVQAGAVAAAQMPNRISAVEVLMHAADERGHSLRPVTPLRPKLRLPGGR